MASALARGIGEPMLVADLDAARAQALADELGGEAVASVLAATPISSLQEAYPCIPVVRTMPNTPVEVRRGVICFAPEPISGAQPHHVIQPGDTLVTVGKAGQYPAFYRRLERGDSDET